MFTIYHFLWSFLSILMIAGGVLYLRKTRPDLEKVINFTMVVCILAELTKFIYAMKFVPSSDGSTIYPYLETQHLPLQLCSLQLFCFFILKLTKNEDLRQRVLVFMYPTCLVGAAMSLVAPSIFNDTIPASQAFTHIAGYRFFIYHSVLIIYGIYLGMCGRVRFSWKTYRRTYGIMLILAYVCLYLNSVFSAPVYENGKLISVEYGINLFFISRAPLSSIHITNVWTWFVYVIVLNILGGGLVALVYLPVLRAQKKRDQAAAK